MNTAEFTGPASTVQDSLWKVGQQCESLLGPLQNLPPWVQPLSGIATTFPCEDSCVNFTSICLNFQLSFCGFFFNSKDNILPGQKHKTDNCSCTEKIKRLRKQEFGWGAEVKCSSGLCKDMVHRSLAGLSSLQAFLPSHSKHRMSLAEDIW